MPIYEFHCPRCQRDFEELVMRSDDLVRCPECACERVERLMSTCAHQAGAGGPMVTSGGGGGCSGCSGGSCSTCH